MLDETSKRPEEPQAALDEEAEAKYFARRYGLAADQLTFRAKLEAAARRLID